MLLGCTEHQGLLFLSDQPQKEPHPTGLSFTDLNHPVEIIFPAPLIRLDFGLASFSAADDTPGRDDLSDHFHRNSASSATISVRVSGGPRKGASSPLLKFASDRSKLLWPI